MNFEAEEDDQFSSIEKQNKSRFSESSYNPNLKRAFISVENMDALDINDELEQAGNDQLKRLDVLLRHLQRSAITKAQFIEKFAPAKEEQFEV